jgi:AMP-activated protein kinase-like protein
MKLGPVLFFPALALVTLPDSARSQASLGIGAGIVRYAGGASFSAFTASPAAQHLSPSFFVGASGAASLLAGGVWAGQGRGDLWAAIPGQLSGVRVAGSTSLAFSTRSDGLAAGSGTALLETLWTAKQGGIALGGGWATGVIEGAPGVGALRLRARSWWQPRGPAQLSLTVEGTRFYGSWYTDLVGGATIDKPRVVASLWLSARVSATYGSTGAASASLQYFVTPSIAVEASGGNYLRDPFQGLPRAGFIGGGVRFFAKRRALSSPAANSSDSAARPLQPLIALHRGDSVVVRFRMTGAQSVAIAGSWNAWTPVAIQGLGGDIWEAALVLPSGTYYFNLVVDGKDWVVPGGVAVIPDGMGGLVAVLTVP